MEKKWTSNAKRCRTDGGRGRRAGGGLRGLRTARQREKGRKGGKQPRGTRERGAGERGSVRVLLAGWAGGPLLKLILKSRDAGGGGGGDLGERAKMTAPAQPCAPPATGPPAATAAANERMIRRLKRHLYLRLHEQHHRLIQLVAASKAIEEVLPQLSEAREVILCLNDDISKVDAALARRTGVLTPQSRTRRAVKLRESPKTPDTPTLALCTPDPDVRQTERLLEARRVEEEFITPRMLDLGSPNTEGTDAALIACGGTSSTSGSLNHCSGATTDTSCDLDARVGASHHHLEATDNAAVHNDDVISTRLDERSEVSCPVPLVTQAPIERDLSSPNCSINVDANCTAHPEHPKSTHLRGADGLERLLVKILGNLDDDISMWVPSTVDDEVPINAPTEFGSNHQDEATKPPPWATSDGSCSFGAAKTPDRTDPPPGDRNGIDDPAKSGSLQLAAVALRRAAEAARSAPAGSFMASSPLGHRPMAEPTSQACPDSQPSHPVEPAKHTSQGPVPIKPVHNLLRDSPRLALHSGFARSKVTPPPNHHQLNVSYNLALSQLMSTSPEG